MAMTMTARPRSMTRSRGPVHYECRVVRDVVPNQPGLVTPLGILALHTSNFVDYRSPNKLSTTLVMLDGILRGILRPDRRGAIPREDIQRLEAGLRNDLTHAQYADYDIPVNPFDPLGLYGRHKDRLAVRLARRDYRLLADRAVVEAYLQDEYEQINGNPVSRRFIDRHTRRLDPHITIGTVLYENMSVDEVAGFQADPAFFLAQAVRTRVDHLESQLGEVYDRPQVIWPEVASLNGLSVYCQQRQR